MGYRVDIPRSIAALITGDPRLGDSAMKLLAHSVLWILRNDPTSGRWARRLPDDPDEFVANLRSLHDKGWISVWDGRYYVSEPVYGPLGNLVDRVRLTDTDRRFLTQVMADQLIGELGEEVN
jgi:hypothetical protein